jgi:hypothetical protein
MPRCIPKLAEDIRICMTLFIFPSTAIPDGPKRIANSFVNTKPTRNLIVMETSEKEKTLYKSMNQQNVNHGVRP